MLRCYNRVTLLLCVLMLLALALPFASYAPNRLVSGEPLTLFALPGGPALWLLPGLGGLLVLPFVAQRPRVLGLTLLWGEALFLLLLLQLGRSADELAGQGSAIARTSPGGGFWLLLALCLLLCHDATRRLTRRPVLRWLLQAQIWLLPLLMLAAGRFDELSLLKEYANRRAVFHDAFWRHLLLVIGTLIPALLIGVPLGLWCRRRPGLRGPVFTLLNIIQTIPSVALFGLLIAPLAGLSRAWLWLGELGVSGTGLAPALIALVLYALLPLTRSVVAGLDQTPRQVMESARGMGMSGARIFWQVEVPLALTVLLRGMRLVAVQTVGMGTIAALIGAGGFGALVFQGLLSSALDLVLLGVIPVIAMAVLVDGIFNLIISRLKATTDD